MERDELAWSGQSWRLPPWLWLSVAAMVAGTLHILLDASRSMAWGEPAKLRYASQIAAALGYVALARFDRLTITAEAPNYWGR